MAESLKATASKTEAGSEKTAVNSRSAEVTAVPETPMAKLMQLHQTYGNLAVQRWLASGALQGQAEGTAPGELGSRRDPVQLTAVAGSKPEEPLVQRQGEEEVQTKGMEEDSLQKQDEEEVQTKGMEEDSLQKQDEEEVQTKGMEEDSLQKQDEEEVQTKGIEEDGLQKQGEEEVQTQWTSGGIQFALRNRIDPFVSPEVLQTIQAERGQGEALDGGVRFQMERSMGTDFNSVRVHRDNTAARLNNTLSAKAFTNRNDIYFNQGQYNPESRGVQHLIAHELAHVVQQRSIPDLQFQLKDSGTRNKYEQEANVVADTAVMGAGSAASLKEKKRTEEPTLIKSSARESVRIKNAGSRTDNSEAPKTKNVNQAETAIRMDGKDIGNPVMSMMPLTDGMGSGEGSDKTNRKSDLKPSTISNGKTVSPTENGKVKQDKPESGNRSLAQQKGKETPSKAVPTNKKPQGIAENAKDNRSNAASLGSKAAGSSKDAADMAPAGMETYDLFKQFSQRVESQKQSVFEVGEARKQLLLGRAADQKRLAEQSHRTELGRLEKIHTQVLTKIHQDAENGYTKINAQRKTSTANIHRYFGNELKSLQGAIASRQNEVQKLAENKATVALETGESEAKRALAHATSKANSIKGLAGNAPEDVRKETVQISQSAARTIMDEGNEIARTAREDARKLADKFRDEGAKAAESFVEVDQKGRDSLAQVRDEAIVKLDGLTEKNLNQIKTDEQQAITEVNQGYQQNCLQLQQLLPHTFASIDQIAQTGIRQVDVNVQKTINFIEQQRNNLSQEIGIYPDRLIQENMTAAESKVSQTITQYQNGLGQISNHAETASRDILQTAVREATKQVDQVAQPMQQVGIRFEAHAGKTANQTVGQMGWGETECQRSMQKVVKGIDQELGGKVRHCDNEWKHKLQEGIPEIKRKVTDGLANLDKLVAETTGKVRELAAASKKQKEQSFIGKVWEGIKGFFSGIWEKLTEIFKSIIDNIGIILLIVLVVLVIVLIIAVVLVFAGVFVTIGAALAAIFAVIGDILLVIGVIFAIIAIVVLVITAVRVFGDKNMSIYDKWRAIGNAFGDVLLSLVDIFVALKYLGLLGKLLRMAKGPGEVLALIRKVGSIAKLLELMKRVDNIGDMLRLLDKVENVSELIRLLDKVKDVGQLLQLLDKVKDAKLLLQLLNKSKDAKLLLQLLDKVKDGKQILQLLQSPKIKDASQLERLLGLVKEPNSLNALLKLADDGAQLERLLIEEANDIKKVLQLLEDLKNARKKILRTVNELNNKKIALLNLAGKLWKEFCSKFHEEFLNRLRQFRGSDNLEPTKGFRGGEGQLFLAPDKPNFALKRWFENRLGDFNLSIQKLKDARKAIEAHPALKSDIEVINIHEVGSDWILRDFEPLSKTLKDAIKESPKARAAFERVVKELKEIPDACPELMDILKKLEREKGPSANIHWSPRKGKIIVIDML